LAETAADLPALDAHRRTLATIGVELMLIDGPAARRLAPALAPSLAGALDCPEEAQVNPYLATLALVEAGREAGVRTLFGRRPAAIAAVGDTNPRLELVGDGASTITLNAGRVVLAAGVGTPALAALVGVELPIRPRRGELVVTAGPGIACDRVLVSGRYLAAKAGSGAAPLGHGFVMERLATGQSLIGGTRVFAGDDRRATAEGVALILREAILRVPAVAAATVLRAFAGLRPATPDGRALIGALPDQPRLLVAAGHDGDGITAAPATAEILCHLLAGGAPPPIDLAPFAPTRFTPPSAGAGPGAAGTG
jgi:sarcosine oxidase subunit beta